MLQINEKLEHFTNTVMDSVTKDRYQILEQANQQKERLIDEKETESLEEAYLMIQREMRKIRKEKNEVISRAIMDGRRKLLHQREQIVNEVFIEVENEMKKFKESDQYISYLISLIQDACQSMGDGDVVIYIHQSDENFLERINSQIPYPIEMVQQDDLRLGGCKVMSKSKNMIYNVSLLEKLQDQRQSFIQNSGLVIE